MEISPNLTFQEWTEVYKKLTYWELKLEKSQDEGMAQVLKMQKDEANQVFTKFIERNYLDWIHGSGQNRPVQSHNLMKKKFFRFYQMITLYS